RIQELRDRFFSAVQRSHSDHESHAASVLEQSFASCLVETVQHSDEFIVYLLNSSIGPQITLFSDHLKRFQSRRHCRRSSRERSGNETRLRIVFFGIKSSTRLQSLRDGADVDVLTDI